MEETVSYREFAKMVGLSEGAVRKAVGRGSINEGVVRGLGDPQIIPSVASKEWGKPIVKPVDTDDEDSDAKLEQSDDSIKSALGIDDSMDKAEAERQIAVYKAKKARLEYLEMEGQLVDKGLVFQNLFEFAKQISDTLLNIPDKVIDNILAADTRNESIIILDNAIAKALTTLATPVLEGIDLTKGK